MTVKRLVVRALSRACDLTHATRLDRLDPTGRLLGCRLATWSDVLDQRWQTGVWRDVTVTYTPPCCESGWVWDYDEDCGWRCWPCRECDKGESA